jgi:FlgN protein
MTAIIEHLRGQLSSARRLLQIVLAQADSIRAQDAEGVLARLADVQTELATRHRLEAERDQILRSTAARLGIPASEVDLEAVLAGGLPAEANVARELSAELRGVLGEVTRIHEQNRVLIRQELAFLGHLLRVMSGAPQSGYSPSGWVSTPQPVMTVDARA